MSVSHLELVGLAFADISGMEASYMGVGWQCKTVGQCISCFPYCRLSPTSFSLGIVNATLLCYGYEPSYEDCVLKTWCLAGGIIEKYLGHNDP